MKVKQRVLALMLSVMMIVTYMPAIAFAGTEEPAEGDVPAVTDVQAEAEAAEEETAQPEAAEAQTEEAGTEAVEEKAAEPEADGAESEDVVEPELVQEETATPVHKKGTIGSTTIKPDTALANSDELLWDYLNEQLSEQTGKSGNIGEMLLRGASLKRGDLLTGTEKLLYDYLKDQIQYVIRPDEDDDYNSTNFWVPIEAVLERGGAYPETEINVQDPENPDGTVSITVHEVPKEDYDLFFNEEGLSADLDSIINALIADFPAYLYWYDKTKGVSVTPDPSEYYEGEDCYYFTEDPGMFFSFIVSADYSETGEAGTTDLNRDKRDHANTAVDTADEIIKSVSESPYNTLFMFKDRICELTDYDDDAAANEDTPYGDPWQMINVFDNDPETKVVCEGYSKAFQYLCDNTFLLDDAGVQCDSVTGTMDGGTGAGRHMWNILHMDDGRNYIADITNCDDGSVGAPDELFLKGYFEGTVDDGYSYLCGDEETGSTVSYSYNSDTRKMYSDEELEMSASDYGEGGSEPADHEISYTTNHVFYENSCGYDDTRYIIDDEYEDYYHYNLDIFEGDVLTVDGEEYVYSTYEGAFVGEENTISRDDVGISDKQAVEPWVLVNNEDTEVTYGMEYAGSEVTVTATLSPRPEMEIAYTKASPLIEETNGYTDEEGGWWYYYLEPAEGDVLTIDGTEYTYHEEFYDEDTDVDYPQGFYTADYSEKLDASYLTMESDPDQGEVHWTLGDDEKQKDFNVKVAYKGIETTATWTLIKNPVQSLSYTTTHEFIENKGGETKTDEDGNEYFDYNLYRYKGDVLTINGVEYKYRPRYDDYKATDESQAVISVEDVDLGDAQYSEHWVIPDGETETTVSYYIEYMGIQAEVTATLKKNPVAGIEFTPANEYIDRIFEVDGNWEEDEEGNEYFDYYRPRFAEGDKLTVKYSDGRGDVTYFYRDGYFVNPDNEDDYIYDGDEDGVNIEAVSSVDWTQVGKYDTTVTYEGYSVEGPKVHIVENPIESISFSRNGSSKIELTEGVDSELDSERDDNNEWIEYERYYLSFELGDRITVNKTGGEESAEYVYREIKDGRYTEELFINVNDDSTEITDNTDILNDEYLSFDAKSEQTAENPWKVGGSYKAVVSYYNIEANVDVTIKANPVTNITFEGADGSHTVKLYEKVNGYRGDYEDDDGTYKEFFCYYRPSFNAGDKLIVTKDGGMNTYVYTEHLFTGEYYTSGFVNKSEAASEDDYILVDDVNDIDDNQVDPDPWTVGGSGYWFRLKALGCLFKVGAEVLENPVKAFDFSRAGYDANQPIELTEGLDAFVNSDGANNRWFEYYLDYKKGDTITLTDNDDVTSAYNAVPYSESDAYAQYFENEEGKRVRLEDIEQSSDQSKQNVWAADDSTHTISLEYFARTKNVDVKIVKNPVQSLAFTRPGSDSVELIREGDGYWDRNNFYYEINFKEGDELSVTYDGYSEPVKYVATASANGEVEKFVAEGDVPPEAESKISKYDLYYMHNVDWRIDEKPSVMLMYKGMYTDVDVTLTDNQVESFEFVRPGSGDKIELVEGKDGNDEKYNDPDEGLIEWFEYRLFYAEGDVLEVKYAGTDKPVSYVFTESENGGAFIASGSVPAGAPEKIFEDDIRRESTQGYGREWKVGNDYEFKLSYLGKTFAVPVTIVEGSDVPEPGEIVTTLHPEADGGVRTIVADEMSNEMNFPEDGDTVTIDGTVYTYDSDSDYFVNGSEKVAWSFWGTDSDYDEDSDEYTFYIIIQYEKDGVELGTSKIENVYGNEILGMEFIPNGKTELLASDIQTADGYDITKRGNGSFFIEGDVIKLTNEFKGKTTVYTFTYDPKEGDFHCEDYGWAPTYAECENPVKGDNEVRIDMIGGTTTVNIKIVDEITPEGIIASGTVGKNKCLNWVLDKNGTLTISGEGDMNPDVYHSPQSPWDSYKDRITKVVIESGVTSVGYEAFYEHSNLTSVTIPESVTSIADSAFYDCVSLENIDIPDSVNSMGTSVFCGCSKLKSITIPNGVKSVGEYGFAYCEALTTVVLPESLKSIGKCAFDGCRGLTEITIPESVTTIGSNAIPSRNTMVIRGVVGSAAETYANDNNIRFVDINACDHIKGEPVRENVVDASCTAEGSYDEVVYCTICGEELSREHKTIAKKAHTEEVIPAVAVTCTEAGATEGKKCSVCGTVLVAPEEIPALGHELKAVDANDATFEKEGNSAYWTCSRCGKYFSDADGKSEIAEGSWVIPKLTWDKAVEQTEGQIDDAGEKATEAEKKAAETSTDENDAAEAQAAAEKAVALAEMAEEAAKEAYKNAQEAFEGASEDQKDQAQQQLEIAAANLAVAKKLVAAANSTKAKAKKAAAKIASNKAEAAAEAAAKASNSATAEDFRKEAEAASKVAAAAAGDAEAASTAAAAAAGELDELVEKFENTPVAENIKAAQADANTSAGTASDAAGAADSSSTEAKKSSDDAKTVVDNKVKAEKEAKDEADRQGVADKTIPKLKISKPSVKKATITAKWKKLTSKQLKKSKATKIEVWVCPNKAFRKADTKIVTVSKKKASAKVKGLKRKTKYFVKVRAIKYVGNVKKVGPWSKTKPIKTK